MTTGSETCEQMEWIYTEAYGTTINVMVAIAKFKLNTLMKKNLYYPKLTLQIASVYAVPFSATSTMHAIFFNYSPIIRGSSLSYSTWMHAFMQKDVEYYY